MSEAESIAARDIAPAKLNLALHVRGKLPDGRHAIETIFAFCIDGDRLSAEPTTEGRLSLLVTGEFANELDSQNLVTAAAISLRHRAGIHDGAAITLDKRLPVAAGVGGGSADAAAALRLLTSLWQLNPEQAQLVAPSLGSDVPACLLSLPMRGEGAGDQLSPVDLSEISGTPVLLINPRVQLSTAQVFAAWDGRDLGPLEDWRRGRNDLETPAIAHVPQIETVLAWLALRPGVTFTRMSGSGATCFAFFASEDARDAAEHAVPREWWKMATFLR